MAIAEEIEAKLLVPQLAVLDRIATERELLGHRLVPQRRARLETTYFDTRELALLRAGMCLRVRRDGRRHEATIKWLGRVEGGLHSRPELTVAWSPGRRATGSTRAALRLPPGPLHDQLAAVVAGRALRPILITHIDRRIVWVTAGSGRRTRKPVAPLMELALDRVAIERPGGRGRRGAEYGELELEQRAGDRAVLIALARELQGRYALVPTRETKLGRGLAQLYGRQRLAALERATEPVSAGDTLGSALAKAVDAQLRRIRAHDPGTRAGLDPEELHRMRVGTRRSRAAVRMLGGALGAAQLSRVRRELRWLGRALGSVRDLDVQLEHHARWRGRERAALQRHVRLLERERAQRRRGLLAALDSRRYAALVRGLERIATKAGAPAEAAAAPLPAVGAAELERALAAVDKRGRKLFGSKTPDERALHALRIRVRRARYGLELLSPLAPKPSRRAIARLTRLQDELGAHQDAVVAERSVAAQRARLGSRAQATLAAAFAELEAREQRRATEARARAAKAFRELSRARREIRALVSAVRDAQPPRPARSS